MLETLLVFVGIPVLVFVIISLLVMAPSLAKGRRFSPGQPWDAAPEWFGATELDTAESAAQQPQLAGSTQATTASTVTGTGSSRATAAGTDTGSSRVSEAETGTGSSRVTGSDTDTGGASVRW